MSDITERLRSLYVQHGTNYVQEAAREIERLRARLEIDGDMPDGIECRDATIDALDCMVDQLKAESIALTSRLAGAEQERDKYRHQWEQQCAITAISTDRAAELWAQAMEKADE